MTSILTIANPDFLHYLCEEFQIVFYTHHENKEMGLLCLTISISDIKEFAFSKWEVEQDGNLDCEPIKKWAHVMLCPIFSP